MIEGGIEGCELAVEKASGGSRGGDNCSERGKKHNDEQNGNEDVQ